MSRSFHSPVQAAMLVLMFVLTLLAWVVTYLQARSMTGMMRLGVPMSLGMEGVAAWSSFFVFSGMWLVMMVAMMLPSTYPALMLYRTVFRKRYPGLRGGTFLFAGGYFLAWTATGVLFYGAYVLIGLYRTATPDSGNLVLRAAGATLILAGLYQWSPLKRACLRHCQSPLDFLGHNWREGRWGAVRMGAHHGIYCFGCCWGLMVVLAVMGVMHLGWMAAIAAIILVEKVNSRRWVPGAVGAVFIVIGLLIALFPTLLRVLSSQVTVY